jgi:hypothetical protein
MGFEPTPPTWEGSALPLSYTRILALPYALLVLPQARPLFIVNGLISQFGDRDESCIRYIAQPPPYHSTTPPALAFS